MNCHYCGCHFEQHDLRPYGPNSAMVCFPCATSTPEREKIAQEQFAMQLNGSGPVVVLDGTNAGPYPAEHHPEVKQILAL